MLKRLPILIFCILLILLSFPAVAELTKPGYFSNHDGVGHIIRLQEFDIAIKDGAIPPRLDKNLMFGYGYYFFNFNYPLVYYLGEIIHSLGFDFVSSINILALTTFVLSGLGMFLWQRKHWGNIGGFVAGMLYMYAPYRFLNMYVRGSIAEHLAFVILPLLFMFTESIAEGSRRRQTLHSVLGGIAYALLLLSHNITAFIFTIILGLFMLFHLLIAKRVSVLVHFALLGIIGLGLTTYFWLPSLAEKGYVRLDNTIAQDYPHHFVYFQQLINSPWGFGGSVEGSNDGLSFQIGKLHLIFLLGSIFALVYLWKTKRTKAYHLLFYLGVFILAIFFMLPISKPLWDKLPLFSFVQFPWRFLSWTVFAAAVIGGAVSCSAVVLLHKVNKFLPYLLVPLVVSGLFYLNHNFWKVNQRIQVSLSGNQPIPGSTTWADEQFPIWFEPKPTSIPKNRVEIISGKADVSSISWKTAQHTYKVDAQNTSTLVENTAYYPGWEIFNNNQPLKFDYRNKNYPGRMVYTLPQGQHTIESKFIDTPLRTGANLVSVIFVFLTGAFALTALKRT
ncbi:MAG: hypothetical protein HY376_01290 [Candidatus Blackburnbacteria bacterium]|nr:hypothetical protein [Candidatus Blackburnbacteria bacterium]